VGKVLVSTTSTGRLFHRAGAATENARLASSVRVLGTIKRGVLDGRRAETKRSRSAANSDMAAMTTDEP